MKKKIKSSIDFFKNYTKILNKTLRIINYKKIENICNIIEEKIINNCQIFVAGNGGSAAVANHLLCDFNKGIKNSSNHKLLPKIISLSNSLELITAISNDINYTKIFSHQLENYANEQDCIILFSCSGSSKNVLEAIKVAKEKNIKIIFITGFSNTKISGVDIHLNLNCKNYGITEDIFSSIMHMISQKIRAKYSYKNEIL